MSMCSMSITRQMNYCHTRGTESVVCNYRQPNIPRGPAQRCRRLTDCRYIALLAETFFMFLFLTLEFLCLVYFPVDLEVFYLGHVKNLYTIQYTVEVLCGCRYSSAHDNGQLHHGAVFWPAERSRRAGSQLCPRH